MACTSNGTLAVIQFDYQKKLISPGDDIPFYRKLTTSNLVIYDLVSRDAYCFLSDQYEAPQTSIELGTALYNYITEILFVSYPNCKKLILWSDNGSGVWLLS